MQGTSPLFAPGLAAAAPPRSARDLIAVIYRQAGLIALCTVVGAAASFTLYARQPRIYTSSAKVWVQTEQQGSPSFLSGIAAYRETPYPDPVNRKIETEIALMLTRTSARAVIDKLGIRDDQLAHGGRPRSASAIAAKDADDARASPPTDPRSKTVDLFLEGVSVEPVRSKTADTASNVLEVKFDCADPALAPLALQAFIDNYLQLGVIQNRRLGETTSALIETKLTQAKQDLRDTENQIAALMVRDGGRSSGVVGGAVAGGDNGAGDGAGSVGSAYAAAGAVSDGGLKLDLDPDASAGAGNGSTPVVAALKSQSLALQLRLDEARQLYTDNAENVRQLSSELAGVQRRLTTTVRQNTQLEADLSRLQRQRQLAQERYVELQRKLDQIDLYLRLNPTEAASRVVIDSPDHPGATEGHKKAIVAALGPLAGLMLGLLLAGLRELGGDRMRSPRETEWALGVPVLGAIPTLPAKVRDAYLGKPSGEPAFATSRLA